MSTSQTFPQAREAYPFLCQVAEIRCRAHRHIQRGAARPGDAADCNTVLRLLNEALATELACVLRYRRYGSLAHAAVTEPTRQALVRHADEEQQHADRLAERIGQLGGTPDSGSAGLGEDRDPEGTEADGLADMLEEDLVAERVAIESYREIVQYLGTQDSGTRWLFESILSMEQEHARELASMRADMLRRDRAPTRDGTNQRSGEMQ